MSNTNVTSWTTHHKKTYEQMCEETKKYGPLWVKIALIVKEILNKLKVTWWLDTGNLMGAYRNGKMILHDDDFDIAILSTKDNFESLFEKIKKELDGKL